MNGWWKPVVLAAVLGMIVWNYQQSVVQDRENDRLISSLTVRVENLEYRQNAVKEWILQSLRPHGE